MLDVCLAAVTWCQAGGWPTFTFHLYRALQRLGCSVAVWTGLAAERPQGAWRAQMTFDEHEAPPAAQRVVVVSQGSARLSVERWLERMGRAPDATVLHDPQDWRKVSHPAYRTLYLSSVGTLCFVGERDLQTFCAQVGRPAHAAVLPHPYLRHFVDPPPLASRPAICLCTARVDFDKNTHLLLAAGIPVEIWTSSVNWKYNWLRIRPILGHLLQEDPCYHGGFGVDPEEVAAVYLRGRCLCDLSTIAGGGGRTQYTFLEAMDAGLPLVLHRAWGEGPELREGLTHWTVRGPADLRKGFATWCDGRPNPFREAHARILAAHDGVQVARQLLHLLAM